MLIGTQGSARLTLDAVASSWGHGAAEFHALMREDIARCDRRRSKAFVPMDNDRGCVSISGTTTA